MACMHFHMPMFVTLKRKLLFVFFIAIQSLAFASNDSVSIKNDSLFQNKIGGAKSKTIKIKSKKKSAEQKEFIKEKRHLTLMKLRNKLKNFSKSSSKNGGLAYSKSYSQPNKFGTVFLYVLMIAGFVWMLQRLLRKPV